MARLATVSTAGCSGAPLASTIQKYRRTLVSSGLNNKAKCLPESLTPGDKVWSKRRRETLHREG